MKKAILVTALFYFLITFLTWYYCGAYAQVLDNLKRDSLIEVLKKYDQNKISISQRLLIQADTMKANLLWEIYSLDNFLKNPDEQKQRIDQIKRISYSLNYKRGIANVLTGEGYFLSKKKQYKEALALHKEALKIRLSIRDNKGISYSYYNIGCCYQWMNLYKDASIYFFKSTKLAEADGDSLLLYKSFSSTAYLLQFMGNLNESISYQKKAITYINSASQKDNYCIGIIFLADYYALNQEPEKADSVLKVAYQIARELNSPYHLSYYYNIESEIHAQGNNYGLAILSLLNSNKIESEMPLSENLHYNYANIATYLLEADNTQLAIANIPYEKKYDEVIRYAQKSLDITIPAGIASITSSNYYHMNVAYQGKKDFEKALKYFTKYVAIKDSIFNSTNMQTIQDLKLKYETEKKEQQIELLQNENKIKALAEQSQRQKTNYALIGIGVLVILGGYIFKLYSKRKKLSNQLSKTLNELKSTQQQLINTEKEKEAENIRVRISRDIHDDIGHNLTKIALLSSMTANSIDKNTAITKENLERISEYSRTVNSSLSEIVWAVSPKHDTLDSLVIYMRNHIHKFFEGTEINYKINFTGEFENRNINPDLKRNIFLVLKESLNNILKFAKAKNVSVDFKINGCDFELKIKDDGVGFTPLSHADEPGVIPGNGLQNMYYRMQQSRGSFLINSSPGNGCEVVVNGKF